MPPSEPAAVVVFVLQLTTHIVALTFMKVPRDTYQYHRIPVPKLIVVANRQIDTIF